MKSQQSAFSLIPLIQDTGFTIQDKEWNDFCPLAFFSPLEPFSFISPIAPFFRFTVHGKCFRVKICLLSLPDSHTQYLQGRQPCGYQGWCY